MANKYAVVRTDNMFGTDVRAGLVSLKYMGADGAEAAEIENGSVVKLKELAAGEREIFVAVTPAANDEMKDIALVAAPEVMYDEHMKNLDAYINEAGKTVRGYLLHDGNIFSVTSEALVGDDPKEGDVVELAAGTKLKAVASATAGSTVIGKIIAVENAGRYTYYVIRVGEVAAAGEVATA